VRKKEIKIWWLMLILNLFIPSIALSSGFLPGYGTGFNLKGYYKNLFSVSETSSGKDYYSDLNRLRVELDISFNPEISAKAIYDNEVILGEILNTQEFLFVKKSEGDVYYDMDSILADNPDLYWRHSIYRLYLTYTDDLISLTAGRQRIAMGVGRIWNPEDVINPINPVSIERTERTGVDAVKMDFSINAFSNISFIYVKKLSGEGYILKGRSKLKGYDLSVMGSRIGHDDYMIGFDFSGYIEGSGFRGEATYTFDDKRDDFLRFVLSWDYTFPDTFYILMEYLYNGGNIKDENIFIQPYLNEITTKNQNFWGIELGYDITPLFRADNLLIFDVDDKSYFINPSLKYNIFEDMDVMIGALLFEGDDKSEYGKFSHLYYAQMQFYF